MTGSRIITYAEERERIERIATDLERIAYRLRQGAIAPERARDRLRALAGEIAEGPR